MTKRVRGIVAFLLAAVVLLSAGCGDTATQTLTKVKTWAVTPIGLQLTASVTDVGSGTVLAWFTADTGYQWLAVRLHVKNLTKSSQTLGLLEHSFTLVTKNGTKYDEHFALQDPIWKLPESYEPGQEQWGNVYFQVPASWTAAAAQSARLLFSYFPTVGDDQDITISLTSVPSKDVTSISAGEL